MKAPDPFTRLLRQLAALSPEELLALRRFLDALLAGALSAQDLAAAGLSLQREYRKCGKPGCRCEQGRGHGPYLYAHWYADGRHHSKYLGKIKEEA